MSSFATQITKQTALVYDIRVTLHGLPCYFIVKVAPAQKQAFLEAIAKQSAMELTDYGTILHRGWDEPTENIRTMLHAEYGIYESIPKAYTNEAR